MDVNANINSVSKQVSLKLFLITLFVITLSRKLSFSQTSTIIALHEAKQTFLCACRLCSR